jgi:hypothetical protein
MIGRECVKEWMGSVPLTAELMQRFRPGASAPPGAYRLERLEAALPGWVTAVQAHRRTRAPSDRTRVLLIGSLRWWVEYCAAVGLLLAADGHRVDLGLLPYRTWTDEVASFDRRRQVAYLSDVLRRARPVLRAFDISGGPARQLPETLVRSLEQQSLIDVQYTLQREVLDLERPGREADLYGLRLARNLTAAGSLYPRLANAAYDVLLLPNGSILEYGALYRTARSLGLRTVTFEFGEQRQRMWIAQDAEAMRLDTSALWKARGALPLDREELARLETLYQARKGAQRWSTFARQWQAGRNQGALAAAEQLGLDPAKPIALLCTNVVGDSLALDRQVFTRGMAEWLEATVRYFAGQPQAQLVVRVHPGELRGAGHPSVDIVRNALPELPAHVVVVPPDSKVNTYDLVELAHVGLVYTTTVGMEMAMQGVPIIVAGRTHYRARGFTEDPESLEAYLAVLDRLMRRPLGTRLEPSKVETAWQYAYRFFFEFPFAFPWHLIGLWDDLAERPLEMVVRPEVLADYAPALAALRGSPVDWAVSHDPGA